jgi:hypothetical protein
MRERAAQDEAPPGGETTTTEETAGRASRGPDEGPASDGGSALDANDEAAVEEIGGG